MSKCTKTIFGGLIFVLASCSSDGGNEFTREYNRITESISCVNPEIIPADELSGALYSCIGGAGETIKVFVNEANGKVQNTKFMWNDWTKDLGYGIHADYGLAKSWLSKISPIYAQGYESQVEAMFFSELNQSLKTPNYLLEYRYTKGPSMDERLYIITSREVAEAKADVVKKSVSSYENCRSIIANTVGYSSSAISGDGNPVVEGGYKSFFFTGRSKDQFFCEVHENNNIRIKAAIGGKYPFKYIK